MAEGGVERSKSELQVQPRQCSPSGGYSSDQWENASEETSRLMDALGYGTHIVQARRDAYRKNDWLLNRYFGDDVTLITAGSKGEGLTSLYESDADQILVLKGVLCLEDGVYAETISREVSVFILDIRFCSPGHCRLLLRTRGLLVGTIGQIKRKLLDQALVEDGFGGTVLCHDLLLSYFLNVDDIMDSRMIEKGLFRFPRAGPSLPCSIIGVDMVDQVLSLHCHCPSILNRWATRHRQWPSSIVVKKVVSMGAFVTPVGFKGSENKHVEWRLCFNTGEIELMCNLNDAQTKIYVLLKMIIKNVLKPRNKEMTSYTVKNIVFWLAEKNQQTLFHNRSLLYWLREGLMLLRTAIDTMHLPYYMIPERNLFAACGMRKGQQRTWITTISDMIDEGPRIVLRLPNMRKAIIAHPEPLLLFYRVKTELELLTLLMLNSNIERKIEGTEAQPDRLYEWILQRYAAIVIGVLPWVYRNGNVNDLFYNFMGLYM